MKLKIIHKMSGLNWQLVMEKFGPQKLFLTNNINPDDIRRVEKSKELGLPETATWADINKQNDDIRRIEKAKELGLPETATWADINKTTQ